jgi:adenylate cyclase
MKRTQLVSANKRLAERLRDSEALYHSLVENLPQNIFRKDLQGRFTFANQRLCQTLGKPLKEILGKTDYDVIVPELAEKYRGDDRRIIETGEAFETVEEQQTPGGERIWVQVVKTPLHDGKGKIVGVQGIYWDVTARKKAEEALRLEKKRSERLLLNIIPKSIATRLKSGEKVVAVYFPEVTVLFADLVGFTRLSAGRRPEAIVRLLNQVFSAFDGLTEEHHLEKIKTIGDAYMVVGGLPETRPGHATAIAEMALDMREMLDRLNRRNRGSLKLRIGINTGPVVAGIIGRKKFSYDLWGETVNVASRMETHAPPGKIQVAVSSWERLRDQYHFERRGSFRVKGMGVMKAYLLISRKDHRRTR